MRTILPLALFCAVGCASTDAFVFHPARYPAGNWQPKGEDAWFTSADGTKLHGWYLAAERPKAVVLYCHGNAGNVTGHWPMMRFYASELDASSLVFDYRGYGRSEGTPNEQGVLADARAAREWLAKRAGVAEKDIVLVGRSLGGGVACHLAAHDGARALVLENTFTSVPDVAASKLPLLPVGWLMNTRLDSLSCIAQYHGPLLMTHGDADRTIPLGLGQRLFDAANEPKQFVLVPGGTHNAPPTQAYLRALKAFFAALDGKQAAR
jgi:fermentation-respiration switch protein FrsA (DUF1100 family)